ARVQGAEGAKKVRVRLVRERVPAVLGDRGIVESDDGYLIADGRVPEVDGLVVDRGLKRRVEELTSQKEGADGQCEDRQAGDDERAREGAREGTRPGGAHRFFLSLRGNDDSRIAVALRKIARGALEVAGVHSWRDAIADPETGSFEETVAGSGVDAFQPAV